MTLAERHAKLADAANQTPESLLPFTTSGLAPEAADHMIENVIGLYSLPIGIALNFQVNGKDVLVPMTLEEPSVVAGAVVFAKDRHPGVGYLAPSNASHKIRQKPQAFDPHNLSALISRLVHIHTARLSTDV